LRSRACVEQRCALIARNRAALEALKLAEIDAISLSYLSR